VVKKSLKHAVSIVVFLSLLSVASPVKAASLGGSCKKPGQASGASKRPLVCKRVSGKLKWTLASRTPGELLIPTSARFFSSLGIALTWSIPIDKGSSAVTGYRIEFQRTDTPWLFAANAVSSSYSTYIKADELAGARYRFRVAAFNSAGVGVFSESNWVDYTTTSGSGSSSITVPSSNLVPSTTTPSGLITTTTSVALTGTVSQRNAITRATSYLRSSAFSRSGLIGQLQYEGFSIDDATYGVDALNTNWNAQAVKKATSYLRSSSFSRSGLIDQMIFEGFSSSESVYGVDAQNADWNLQAAKKAASYLQSSSFTRGSLISQLLFEGFSQSQAEYGVSTTGL
jgi:hypothetical protein